MESSADSSSLQRSQEHILGISSKTGADVLPEQAQIDKATSQLLSSLPDRPWGVERTTDHLLDTIVPGLNRASLSPNFYGFVTGVVTPAARVADSLVSIHDRELVPLLVDLHL